MDAIRYRIELFWFSESRPTLEVECEVVARVQPSAMELAREVLILSCLPAPILNHPYAWSGTVKTFSGPNEGYSEIVTNVTAGVERMVL